MRKWIRRAAWAGVVMFVGLFLILAEMGRNLPPRPTIAEAPPPNPLLTGTDAKVISYTIGCAAQSDYEALADTAVTMGAEAHKLKAQQYLSTGRCRAFNAGQDVQIAGVAVVAELRAIRPKGEAGTYWTTERALRAAD